MGRRAGGRLIIGGPQFEERGLRNRMSKHRKHSKGKRHFQRAATVTLSSAVALAIATSGAPVAVAAPALVPVESPVVVVPQAPAVEPVLPAPVTISGGERILNQARGYFGVSYSWGGEDQNGMDCSGLVQRVFKDLGVDLPRTSRDQANAGFAVGSLAEAQPGDLLLFDSDNDGVVNHVGIYVNPGRMIDSATYGEVVQERNIWGEPVAIRRIGVVGEEVAPAPIAEAVTDVTEYVVQSGDTLSEITDAFELPSWEQVYEQNKTVIGDNPHLIFPQQVFFVGGLPLANAPVAVEETTSGTLVPGAIFTSEYGPRWGTMHNGIDLAAPVGTPIFAAEAGIVLTAEANNNGFGQWVRVQAADGTITVYGHVDSWLVNVGDSVAAGQQIATVGNRGESTGPHLHFEVHIGPGPVNPVTWLADRGITV